MLTMGLILAFMCVGLEMFIVCKNERLRLFMIRHEQFGLIFSFLLSFLVGEAFGAHGIIALFAGITSTVITLVIYNTHALELVDKYRANSGEIRNKLVSVKGITVKSIVFWWKVFTAPIRFIMAVKRFVVRAVATCQSCLTKLSRGAGTVRRSVGTIRHSAGKMRAVFTRAA